MTIGLVPPTPTGVPNYTVNEPSGPVEVCVDVVSGSLALGRSVAVTLVSSDNSATGTYKNISFAKNKLFKFILTIYLVFFTSSC